MAETMEQAIVRLDRQRDEARGRARSQVEELDRRRTIMAGCDGCSAKFRGEDVDEYHPDGLTEQAEDETLL